MKPTTHINASTLRKIEKALRKGWHLGCALGPCKFIRRQFQGPPRPEPQAETAAQPTEANDQQQ